MGFRFRKSINLGGGFRINISKSGIGYSGGVPGFRITKTAKGTTRRTYSIPGSGLSYVTESSGKNKDNSNRQNNYEDASPEYSEVSTSASLEYMIKAAKNTIILNKISTIGIIISAIIVPFSYWAFAGLGLFLFLKIIARTIKVIKLDYEFDSDKDEYIEKHMGTFLKVQKSQKVWRIINNKRFICKTSSEVPFPFKTNVPAATFEIKGEKLIFLPEMLLIINKKNISAVSYDDISFSSTKISAVERGSVPIDATIIDYRWEHSNKSGEPDRRFKNNRKLPICLYGEIAIVSNQGINTKIIYSNEKL